MAVIIDKYIDQYLIKIIQPAINEEKYSELNQTTPLQ